MPGPDILTLRRPDDWHLHLRDGAMLAAVVPFTARQFARAIVMPNLTPPVTTVEAAEAYRAKIVAALPEGASFTPLMTCYLTDTLDPGELARGHASGAFTAAKLYPAGATTHSEAGITDIARIEGVLDKMQEIGMPLLVHGEVTDPDVDVFDREAVFIERVMAPMLTDFPELKVVFEHVTTEDAVAFVEDGGDNIAATVTAHHLLINRNALFEGGLRPHMYCLPVAKRETHRLALRRAATSGNPKFFLGTDSAPHAVSAKQSDCGCAGIFTAPLALELYAQVFDAEARLDKFEAFASLNGPAFYGLPANEDTVTLVRGTPAIPGDVTSGDGEIVRPFAPKHSLPWTIEGG